MDEIRNLDGILDEIGDFGQKDGRKNEILDSMFVESVLLTESCSLCKAKQTQMKQTQISVLKINAGTKLQPPSPPRPHEIVAIVPTLSPSLFS